MFGDHFYKTVRPRFVGICNETCLRMRPGPRRYSDRPAAVSGVNRLRRTRLAELLKRRLLLSFKPSGDLKATIGKLIELAKRGDVPTIKLLFDRTFIERKQNERAE